MSGRFLNFWLENSDKQLDNCCYEPDCSIARDLLDIKNLDNDVLITIIGIGHYFGKKPFAEGKKVFLQKEPENIHDSFAIAVLCDDIKKCGYVANSDYTVKHGTYSARKIYGGIENGKSATVLWADDEFAICALDDMSCYDLLFGWGVYFSYNDKMHDAISVFRFLAKHRESPVLYQRLSDCYMKNLKLKDALKCINFAINLDKDNAKSLIIRSAVYNTMGHTEKALSDVDAALWMEPDNVLAKKLKEKICKGL
ncbi:MAG: hypothetical protein IJW15_05480 [Clostridia bacterium]|nr:hypothetical protein [Clostridia bacterium]